MSEEQRNLFRVNQLKKQFLYLNEAPDFYEITKYHLGLHSTDYWTPYLSVFARRGDYSPDEIFESLNKGDRLVRINAFRGTNFVIHTDNLALIHNATAPYLIKRGYRVPPLRDFTEEEIEERITSILELVADGPLALRQLRKLLPQLSQETSWIVKLAMAKGLLIRASANHAKSNLTSYALMKTWVPMVGLNKFTSNEAEERIIERYIGVFGPVSEADIAWWLPLSKSRVQHHIKNLESVISRVDIARKPYYIAQNDNEAASSVDTPEKPVVNFLPYEDHFPKAYHDRSWYILEGDQEKVFPRSAKSFWPEKPEPTVSTGPNTSGEIRPSIWLNNMIIGRWELEKTAKRSRVVLSVFHEHSSDVISQIKEKKRELESFVNERLMPISQLR
ncbi:MAG: winged helix DNA-binding domain-containing protein [Candidatus Heimdallarchaeota archaeon]